MAVRSSQTIAVAALALIVPVALAWIGVSRSLGAHPFWDIKTAVIGAPVGCVLGLALMRLGPAARLTAGLAMLGLAATIARYGKTQFAASYAEDALAGKLWYFGWIGIAAGLALTIFALIAPARR